MPRGSRGAGSSCGSLTPPNRAPARPRPLPWGQRHCPLPGLLRAQTARLTQVVTKMLREARVTRPLGTALQATGRRDCEGVRDPSWPPCARTARGPSGHGLSVPVRPGQRLSRPASHGAASHALEAKQVTVRGRASSGPRAGHRDLAAAVRPPASAPALPVSSALQETRRRPAACGPP